MSPLNNKRYMTLEEVTKTAKRTILRDNYHAPTLIIEGTGESLIYGLAELSPSSTARRIQMELAGATVAVKHQLGDLVQVLFIFEAWTTTGPSDSPPAIMPSDDPKRQEALIISRYDVAQRASEMAVFRLVRSKNGRITQVQEYSEAAGASVHSPLMEAFIAGYRRRRALTTH